MQREGLVTNSRDPFFARRKVGRTGLTPTQERSPATVARGNGWSRSVRHS